MLDKLSVEKVKQEELLEQLRREREVLALGEEGDQLAEKRGLWSR